MEGETHNLFEQ